MPITFRELFNQVGRIRKSFSIPTSISHLTVSDELTKADEAFWDFKCENSLDFPFRYSEVHRIISVSKRKKKATLLNVDHEMFQEYGLINVMVNRNLVFRKWLNKDMTIVYNFTWSESQIVAGLLGNLIKMYNQGKVDAITVNCVRDWLLDVPLSQVFLVAQTSVDFEERFQSSVSRLIGETHRVIRKLDPKWSHKFKKDVKEKYYGREPQVHGNEKTRSSKITR